MQALGYDKTCGNEVVFVVSPFLSPGRCWWISVQPEYCFCPFVLSATVKYTKLLFDRLPSTVPVEKIPHDLCPVPQPDTTGKDARHWQELYFKDLLLLWRGMTPEREWLCHMGGEMEPHPQGCRSGVDPPTLQGVSGGLHVNAWSSTCERCVLLGLSEFPCSLPISANDVKARLMKPWWRWMWFFNWHQWKCLHQDFMGPCVSIKTLWHGWSFC